MFQNNTNMIKVQSLKRTIVIQFTTILLPLVLLLAYQTTEDAKRTAALDRQVQLHGIALAAKEHYGAFANGAADAVDTLALSQSALNHLRDAQHGVHELGSRTQTPALIDTAAAMGAAAATLEKEPTLNTLERLRDPLAGFHKAIQNIKLDNEQKLNRLIQHSIAASRMLTQWVIAIFIVVLLLAVTFVIGMIYYLSRPLNLAVSIADRIADGQPVDKNEFNLTHDVGNLIRSLGRMYHGLCAYRNEADLHRKGLEEKIEQLAESQSSLAEAQQLAHMGNWHWDTSAPLAQWSDEMYRVLGLEPGACPADWKSYFAYVDVAEQNELQTRLREVLRRPGEFSMELHITTQDGLYRDVHSRTSSRAGPDGRVAHLYGTVQDITDRKLVEAKMHRLAMYDTLTGLPNRQLFNEELVLAVARAARNNEHLAVMFIDLDRFKRINDTLGHATGDMLLKEVSVRLSQCLRANDYVGRDSRDVGADSGRVARLAGDEFTVTLDALADPQDAARVARRILGEMSRPFVLNGQEVVVTASVGIAIFPQDGEQAEILLKNADVAMYQAKDLGKNTYQFFAGEMNSAAVEKLKLEGELRHALERKQFVLHYQPKIDAVSGHLTGVEALIRWQHPEWGLVPPGRFIPVAEEIGLIVSIGEWVLEEACRQKKAWREAGLPNIDMAMNLASPSFRQPDLVTRVAAALRQYGVPPAELCLEATESILMRDADATMATLNALRGLGVKLSIDDFGTGYSSLSYLRRFPIDQLKIDRSFVQDVTLNSDDAAIVAAIVSLANTLKLEIVAEGVETAEQARTLADQGCRIMQGFFFSKPVPAAEITRLLGDGAKFRSRILHSLRGPHEQAQAA